MSGCCDGENRDCITSIAFVPVENGANYQWFIQQQKLHPAVKQFLDQFLLVVITDRDKGLKLAISTDLPECAPRHCGHHLIGNLPTAVKESKDSDNSAYLTYWSAVKSKTDSDFKTSMNEMLVTHAANHEYLSKITPSLWSDHQFPGMTWEQWTNNLSERGFSTMYEEMRKAAPVAFLRDLLEMMGKKHESNRLHALSLLHKVSLYCYFLKVLS